MRLVEGGTGAPVGAWLGFAGGAGGLMPVRLTSTSTAETPSAYGADDLTPSTAGRAGSFLLHGQKKRTKEKAAPHTRPGVAGIPSRRTIGAAAAKLARKRAQTVLAETPPRLSSARRC
ncbi:hypothetical protein YWS52_25540 [Chitiniphilus shinanonensis]